MSKARWFKTKCVCPRCKPGSLSPNKPADGQECSLCKGAGWARDLALLPEREARLVNKAVEWAADSFKQMGFMWLI